MECTESRLRPKFQTRFLLQPFEQLVQSSSLTTVSNLSSEANSRSAN